VDFNCGAYSRQRREVEVAAWFTGCVDFNPTPPRRLVTAYRVSRPGSQVAWISTRSSRTLFSPPTSVAAWFTGCVDFNRMSSNGIATSRSRSRPDSQIHRLRGFQREDPRLHRRAPRAVAAWFTGCVDLNLNERFGKRWATRVAAWISTRVAGARPGSQAAWISTTPCNRTAQRSAVVAAWFTGCVDFNTNLRTSLSQSNRSRPDSQAAWISTHRVAVTRARSPRNVIAAWTAWISTMRRGLETRCSRRGLARRLRGFQQPDDAREAHQHRPSRCVDFNNSFSSPASRTRRVAA
jgi:hypothetical protein